MRLLRLITNAMDLNKFVRNIYFRGLLAKHSVVWQGGIPNGFILFFPNSQEHCTDRETDLAIPLIAFLGNVPAFFDSNFLPSEPFLIFLIFLLAKKHRIQISKKDEGFSIKTLNIMALLRWKISPLLPCNTLGRIV